MEKRFLMDSYFQGEVLLKYKTLSSTTECELTIHAPIPYIWNVTIPQVMNSPEEILEELKKLKYLNEGSSETI